MDAFTQFGQALLSVCQPVSLLFMLAGVIIGIIFGSIPGLSAAMAVALILPLTFSMKAVLGMNMLVAVYIGGISGGLISAILLNMPGTASSIATCFDGHPYGHEWQGRKSPALWDCLFFCRFCIFFHYFDLFCAETGCYCT